MTGINKYYPFFILMIIVLLITGCQPTSAIEKIEETNPQEDLAIETQQNAIDIKRQGPNDRLPGSLKWGSVVAYTSGIDFAQEEGGLAAVSIQQSQNSSGTTTTVTAGTTNQGDSSQQTTGTSIQGDGTTNIIISNPGVSTEINIDGTITYEGTTKTGDKEEEKDWFKVN